MSWSERGQLLIIGALVLATVLVGLALVLNSAIYAENVATRQGADAGSAVELRAEANVTAGSAIADINANNGANVTYGGLESELDARMADWQRGMRSRQSRSGRWLRVDRTGVTHGWRVMQTNPDRNFTAGGTAGMAGEESWLVAAGVQQVGRFDQNLSRQSLYSAGYGTTEAALANSSYHIAIDEPGASGLWRVYVFQGVGTKNVYVLTEEPDENFVGNTDAYVNFAAGSCSHRTTEWVEMKLRGGTFGGAPCDELGFFDRLNASYDIYYNETAESNESLAQVNRSMGTYDLFVGATDVWGNPYYPGSNDQSPFRRTALYDASYDVGYESGEVDYETTITTAPDRSVVAVSRPTASFTATYDSGTGSYEVDWSASDPDANLDNVELLLYKNGSNVEPVDSTNVSVSGGSASGATDLGPGVSGTEYDIYLVATDGTGATTTLKETDTAG